MNSNARSNPSKNMSRRLKNLKKYVMNITEVCQVPVNADCIIPGNVDVVYAAAPNVILLQWRVKLQHYIIFIMHIFGLMHVSTSV